MTCGELYLFAAIFNAIVLVTLTVLLGKIKYLHLIDSDERMATFLVIIGFSLLGFVGTVILTLAAFGYILYNGYSYLVSGEPSDSLLDIMQDYKNYTERTKNGEA